VSPTKAFEPLLTCQQFKEQRRPPFSIDRLSPVTISIGFQRKDFSKVMIFSKSAKSSHRYTVMAPEEPAFENQALKHLFVNHTHICRRACGVTEKRRVHTHIHTLTHTYTHLHTLTHTYTHLHQVVPRPTSVHTLTRHHTRTGVPWQPPPSSSSSSSPSGGGDGAGGTRRPYRPAPLPSNLNLDLFGGSLSQGTNTYDSYHPLRLPAPSLKSVRSRTDTQTHAHTQMLPPLRAPATPASSRPPNRVVLQHFCNVVVILM
jgi:hypothetical protein